MAMNEAINFSVQEWRESKVHHPKEAVGGGLEGVCGRFDVFSGWVSAVCGCDSSADCRGWMSFVERLDAVSLEAYQSWIPLPSFQLIEKNSLILHSNGIKQNCAPRQPGIQNLDPAAQFLIESVSRLEVQLVHVSHSIGIPQQLRSLYAGRNELKNVSVVLQGSRLMLGRMPHLQRVSKMVVNCLIWPL
jgi:hypothetical protein